jgi:hypothetical protein
VEEKSRELIQMQRKPLTMVRSDINLTNPVIAQVCQSPELAQGTVTLQGAELVLGLLEPRLTAPRKKFEWVTLSRKTIPSRSSGDSVGSLLLLDPDDLVTGW